MAPVAAIIITNLIVLVKVTIRLHGRFKHRRVISEARVAFACNILLGTTWVLAFFAVQEVTMVFQWLFCITNSFQGFFIFPKELRKQKFKKQKKVGNFFFFFLTF